jgi:hypothetical protein
MVTVAAQATYWLWRDLAAAFSPFRGSVMEWLQVEGDLGPLGSGLCES